MNQRSLDQLQQRFSNLDAAQRHRLLTVVALLIGADEALADVRVGLATVEIQFFLPEYAGGTTLNLTPAELLPMVQSAMHTDTKGRSSQLVVRC